jgi:hypothetical protein
MQMLSPRATCLKIVSRAIHIFATVVCNIAAAGQTAAFIDFSK